MISRLYQSGRACRCSRAMGRYLFWTALSIALLAHGSAFGQTAPLPRATSALVRPVGPSHGSELLTQFNASLVNLTKEVTPAVVQIIVTSYGPLDNDNKGGDVALVARHHTIGSGVILTPDGYVITNAHVVEGAQHIRVTLPTSAGTGAPRNGAAAGAHRTYDAKLVGADKAIDLALLKLDARNLPTLALAATRPIHAGEVVLAVGSPEGLESSVTMGVVSSVARQPDPGKPAVYIQTDAPMNPGNSGGPLIDSDGYVIGLNTMILTEGGGSEGLGFAIPAATVQFVYESLRKYGHVHRTEIQAFAQEITPSLAEGLGLPQDWGVIISDVAPKGPADSAGLKAGDIVVSVDGRWITGLPDFEAALYMHSPNKTVQLDLLRGANKVPLLVPALQDDDKPEDLADLIDPKNLIGRLGVFVRDFDDARKVLPDDVRIASGVVVVAQSPELNSYTSSLRAGDIVHAANQAPLKSVQQLRAMLRDIKNGQSVVLQIERDGKLRYVAFDWGD